MTSPSAPAPAGPWWRDRRRRDRVTVWAFAVLGIGGILLGGSLKFARGDQRVAVVTMQRDPSTSIAQLATERQQLKDDCGALPGVRLVDDAGDPRVQGRFPVRFSLRGATNPQQAGLQACVARHGNTVRGYRVEGDE